MNTDVLPDWLFGRFDLSSLPIWLAIQNPTISELIGAGAAMAVILGAIAAIAFITLLIATEN